MSYQQVNSSTRYQSQLSSSQKKEILWNIIEPGDPYDIKKSMIAQLPGDMQNFMGGHIEIICLMQAAEIERLCQYLSEYKLRYREIERRELDRHSYEVQIKELTQKIIESGAHQTQNLKLRDFLKKQTVQLQELRKKSSTDETMNRKYEQALKRIQIITNENNSYKLGNGNMSVQIQQLKAKLLAVQQTKLREIQDLKYTLNNQSNNNYQRWKQEISFQFQTEKNGLEIQIKRFKEINQAKNREIQEYQNRFRKLQLDFDEQTKRQQNFSRLEAMSRQYESRFGVLSLEIERLNQVLMNKAHECESLNVRVRQANEEIERKSNEISDNNERIRKYQLRISETNVIINDLKDKNYRLSESESTVHKYEMKVGQFVEQIQRLNNVLKIKVNEITQLQNKLGDMQYELRKIDLVKRQNDQLKRSVNENLDMKRNLAQFQNRIRILNIQNQKLNNGLRLKTDELHNQEFKIKTYERDIETYKSKIQINERDINNSWRSKITFLEQQSSNFQRQNDELRYRLHDIDELNRKLNDYENRIALMSQQIQRLNEMIKDLRKQNDEYKKKVNEMETKIANLTRTRISESNAQTEELRRKIQQVSLDNRKIPEYENRISMLSQQLQRLNVNLQAKVDQSLSLQNRLRTLQNQLNDSERNRLQSERQVQYFKAESEMLKSKVGEVSETRISIQQYESRIVGMNEEIERLQKTLTIKGQELQTIQGQNRNMKGNEHNLRLENQELKRLAERIQNEGKSNINDYGNRLKSLSEQIQRLNNILKNKEDELHSLQGQNRQYQFEIQNLRKGGQSSQIRISQINQETQIRITQITQQFQYKITNYETRIQSISLENDELKRRILGLQDSNRKFVEYEQRIQIFTRQNESLNSQLKIKADQNNNLENVIRNIKIDFENYKRNSKGYEQQISSYDVKLKQMNQQNEQLKRRLNGLSDANRKVGEYENSFANLSTQIQRLNSILKVKVQQNNNLQSSLRQLQQEIDGYRRTINEYETKITIITQDYQSKIRIYQTNTNQEFHIKVRQLNEANVQLAQYENRVNMFGQQIERLNGLLRDKIQDNSNLQNQYRIVQQQLDGSRRTYNELQIRFSQQQQQNNELRARLQNLGDANKRISEYEGKIALLSQQIQRINSILRMKTQACANLQNEVRSLSQQIDAVRRGTGSYNEKFYQVSNEIERLNKILRITSEQLGEYREKDLKNIGQIQRLNNTLRLKVQQSSRYEYSQIQIVNKLRIVQQRYAEIVRENNDLNNKNNMIDMEYGNAKKHILEYEASIKKLYAEFERLQTILHDLKNQNNILKGQFRDSEDVVEKNRFLSAEIDRLNRIIEGMKIQIQELRLRFSDESALHKRINQHMALMVVLFVEIQSLRQRVKDKQKQVEDVRRSSLAPFKV